MELSIAFEGLPPKEKRMLRPAPARAAKGGTGSHGTPAAVRAPAATGAEQASVDAAAVLADLVAGMARRDEAALAAFYDATISRVYGVALRIVRSSAAAEEVAIDTLHQAWRESGRYDATRGSPLAWLLTMARSRALDQLRARDRAHLHEDPHSLRPPEAAGLGSDPQDLVAALESQGALQSGLAKLAPEQRQMLALAFFRGYTHEEIALHTALPLGTVKSQIRRSLAALRHDLSAM